jgi:4-amino-4-deoxy-L-arabinose transferase-like glycosyltransferase
MKKPRLKHIILSFIPLITGAMLHNGVVFIGVVYLFYYFIYNPKNKSYSFTIQSIFGLVLGIGVALFFYNFMLYKLPTNVSMIFSPEFLGGVAESRASGRTVYLQGMQPTSIGDLITQTPIRIVYFLFSPFPWMIGSFNDLFALLDAFLYFILAIYSYKTLKILKKENKGLAVALFLIIIIFVTTFAWGTSNFGTALRHRHKMVWLLICVASPTFVNSKIGRIISNI